MPGLRAINGERRNSAIRANTTTQATQKNGAKGQLPNIAAFLAINNPNSKQQTDAIVLLATTQQQMIQGTLGT